jgi:cystathionine beta-lyase/cystathionine gamma-synthase
MDITQIIAHLGEEDKAFWQRAISPPIYQTSNFKFETVDDYRRAMRNEKDLSIYTRGNNPTVRLLETKLAALQGTEDALVFASGSAAIAAAVFYAVRSGDHVICVKNVYSWTDKLLNNTLVKFGVTTTMVDGRDLNEIKAAIRPNTTLLFLETPNSMKFELQDLAGAVSWAKSEGLMTICDNSYGSPLNTIPAEVGVDIICHSATKFVGGHSDVVCGLLCASAEMTREIFNEQYMTFGASVSPHAAWLLIRSLRTMPMRIAHSAKTGRAVVSFLESHPKVSRVHWPFSTSHPQHHMVKDQLSHEISMFSFELESDDAEKIEAFCESLNFFQIAASWGGYESLIVPLIAFDSSPHPINMIRMYVGFESEELLINDLKSAFERL